MNGQNKKYNKANDVLTSPVLRITRMILATVFFGYIALSGVNMIYMGKPLLGSAMVILSIGGYIVHDKVHLPS